MQRLTVLPLALATAMVTASGTSQGAAGACPWIVLPTPATAAATAEPQAYDIVFQGLGEKTKVFYGFTVSSLDVAWELTNQQALPDLFLHGRRLEPAADRDGATSYQLAGDSIEPHTIYLVSADTVVDKLEQIDARIEPAHEDVELAFVGRFVRAECRGKGTGARPPREGDDPVRIDGDALRGLVHPGTQERRPEQTRVDRE